MKLRKFYSLTSDVYKVVLTTEEFSELDQQLMAKYGEPELDLGGTITGPPEFELPNDLRRISYESPFTMKFDSDDYVDADDRANAWADEMVTRLTTAMGVLRANSDTFTKEEVESI